jgi:hypothetical protein
MRERVESIKLLGREPPRLGHAEGGSRERLIDAATVVAAPELDNTLRIGCDDGVRNSQAESVGDG